jgi:DNA modification methylase
MLKTNEIYLGDCLELMKEIPDKSIDMILCDLPYGTTAISAINTKRNYIGIEKDEKYFNLAKIRINTLKNE